MVCLFGRVEVVHVVYPNQFDRMNGSTGLIDWLIDWLIVQILPRMLKRFSVQRCKSSASSSTSTSPRCRLRITTTWWSTVSAAKSPKTRRFFSPRFFLPFFICRCPKMSISSRFRQTTVCALCNFFKGIFSALHKMISVIRLTYYHHWFALLFHAWFF